VSDTNAVVEAKAFLGITDSDAKRNEKQRQAQKDEDAKSQGERSVPEQNVDIAPEPPDPDADTLPAVQQQPPPPQYPVDPVAGNAPPEELEVYDEATDEDAVRAFLDAPEDATFEQFVGRSPAPSSGGGAAGASVPPFVAQHEAMAFLMAPEEGQSPDGTPALNVPIGSQFANAYVAWQRGWNNSGMAMEMDSEQPNAEAVVKYQQELQKLPPSEAYSIAMDDDRPPIESWQAFSSDPVGVTSEMISESMAGFTRQMINKGVAPMVIWTGAGALVGGSPGATIGARAGYANAVGLSSYSLEMSSGILDSLQRSGIDISDPKSLAEGLQDPERMAVAREFAEKGAVPVATFDVISAVLAGRLIGRQGTKVLNRLAAGAVETAVQAFLGGAGEASKQLAQDGEITSARSVMAETAVESVMGGIDIAVGKRLTEQERALGIGNTTAVPQGEMRAGDVNVELGGQTISIPVRPRGRAPEMDTASNEAIEANAAAGAAPAPAVVPQPPEQTAAPAGQPGPVPPPQSPAPANTNPEQRPRQFEERVSELPNVPQQTQSLMGSVYDVQRFPDAIAAAKAWINDYGIDAARTLMTEIGMTGDRRAMTPVEIAIAVDLSGRLGGVGDYQGQATVLRVVSRKGQSMGAAIAHLKLVSMMTPEGIIMYSNRLIDDYINTLPPERQQSLREAQSVVEQITQTAAQAKQQIANVVLKEGQFSGERIALRIGRRLGSMQQAEPVLVAVRGVLTGPSVKQAAKPQIAKILQNAGISKGEAESMANAITTQFYKSLDDVRRQLIAPRKPKTGEALKAFAQLEKDLAEGNLTDSQYVARVAAIFGVPAMTPELAAELQNYRKQIEEATDPDVKMVLSTQMYERAMSVVPQDILAQLRAVSYLSMLFAPKTWIRNIGGNTVQWTANLGRDFVVSYVLDPAVTGVQRVFGGEAKRTRVGMQMGARLKGMLAPAQDFRKGMAWAAKQNESKTPEERKSPLMAGLSYVRAMSKLSTQNKWELNDVKDVNRRMFSGRSMQMLESTLSVALGAADRGFFMSQYNATLAQMKAAAIKNGEWTGQYTPLMIEEAQGEAMYAIYQNPNWTSKFIGDGRRWLNQNKEFGLGTAIVPFAQVPGAIAQRGFVDWSPLGFVQASYRGMKGVLYANGIAQTGKFDQAAFNKEFSQALIGTGVWTTGYYLYKLGVITASREEDDRLEAMRKASGLGQYQVNVTQMRRRLLTGDWINPYPAQDGDLLMDYNWIQPISIVAAAGAEYAKQESAAERSYMKEGGAKERAGWLAVSMLAGAKSLAEEPLLQGFTSFNKEWTYSGEPLSAVYDTALGIPSMFVPQLVRQAQQMQDNTMRESRNTTGPRVTADMKQMFMNIGAQLPWVSKSFPPRYDLMGEAIQRYSYDSNSFFNVFLNPARFKRYKADPAFQEMERIMANTGETAMMPRDFRGNKVIINGQSVELDNNQVAAYRYYQGNMTMGIYYRLIASPNYANLPDQQKVDMFVKVGKDVGASVKAGLFGHSVQNLSRDQRELYKQFINGIAKQPPTGMEMQRFAPDPIPMPPR
jgi:hypothetical protein